MMIGHAHSFYSPYLSSCLNSFTHIAWKKTVKKWWKDTLIPLILLILSFSLHSFTHTAWTITTWQKNVWTLFGICRRSIVMLSPISSDFCRYLNCYKMMYSNHILCMMIDESYKVFQSLVWISSLLNLIVNGYWYKCCSRAINS